MHADVLRCLLDDLGDLHFAPLLGGEVLLGVDAELVAAAAFAPLLGRDSLLALGEELGELLVFLALAEVLEEGVLDALDPGVLVDVLAGLVAVGEFEDEGALVDGELLLLVEDDLQLLLHVGLVAEVVLELPADDVVDQGQQRLEVAPAALPSRHLQRLLQAVHEPPAVLPERDRVGVHVRNQRQHFLRQVGLDVLPRHALVHVLAEEFLGVVEGLVELDVGVAAVLDVAVEGLAGGRDYHELLALEPLLEEVDVLLGQVGDLLADEDAHVEFGVLLQEHVDLQHDFPHFGRSHHLDADLASLLLERLHALLLQHVLQRVQEQVQLLLLVLPQEKREHQSLLLRPVLRLAGPQQFFRDPPHFLVHEFAFEVGASGEDVLGGVGFAGLVVAAAGDELQFFLVHL